MSKIRHLNTILRQSLVFVLFHSAYTINQLQAEYVVVSEDKSTGVLSPLEDDQTLCADIDDVLNTYQFPMNTNPLSRRRIKRFEEELLHQDERHLLEYKLNAHVARKSKKFLNGKRLKVVYVPDTLYQLYTIGNRANLPEIRDEAYKDQFTFNFDSNDLERGNEQRIMEEYDKANRQNRDVRCRVNSKLGEKFILAQDKQDLQQGNLLGKFWPIQGWKKLRSSILCAGKVDWSGKIPKQDWGHELLKYEKARALSADDQRLCQEREVVTFLDHMMDMEAKAHAEGRFVLYRATPFNPGEKRKDNDHAWSYSYGFGLFSGFNSRERLGDDSACAWSYMLNSKNYGQATLVKKEYYRNGQTVFFVPPLNLSTSITSAGEWFHPRSKFSREAYERNGKDQYKVSGIAAVSSPANPKKMFELVSDGHLKQEDISTQISKESAIILREPERDALPLAPKKCSLLNAPGISEEVEEHGLSCHPPQQNLVGPCPP